MAGVPRWLVLLCWLAFGLVTIGASCLLNAVLLKLLVPLLMGQSGFPLVLAIFVLFSISLIVFCFFLSVLLPSAERASAINTLLMVLLWVTPDMLGIIPSATSNSIFARRIGALLHPAVAAQVALSYVMEWEKRGLAVGWDNFAQSPIYTDDFNA